MSSLTSWIDAALNSPLDKYSYLKAEATHTHSLEAALLLSESECEEAEEGIREQAEAAMIEAVREAAADPLGVWLDYVLPKRDERRSADFEPF